MRMMNSYFRDIVYGQDELDFSKWANSQENNRCKSAILILPHASLGIVKEHYALAYQEIAEPKKLIVICPLHSGMMSSDEGEAAVTVSGGDYDTGKRLIKVLPFPGMKVDDSYLEEEYSLELVLETAPEFFPTTAYMPVFCSSCGKKDRQRLLDAIKRNMDGDTSIIISSNFTKEGTPDETYRDAKELESLLISSSPLAEAINAKRVSACGSEIIESLRTLSNKPYRVIHSSCGMASGPTIEKGDGKIFHTSLIKEL